MKKKLVVYNQLLSAAEPNQPGGVAFLPLLSFQPLPYNHDFPSWQKVAAQNMGTRDFVGGLYFFIPKILLLLLHSIF